MAKPSQLSLLNLEKQKQCAMALADVSITKHVEKRKTSDSSKKTNFSSLYTGTKFFSDGPRFMTVDNYRDKDRLEYRELSFQTELCFSHNELG
ncbi:unnamed protein product [Soboliphyme baturini]|uniref:Uncharacterized protein n=1 Tax=Soboliphyme baturini TaxID=241478 RepID=A0A183ITY7_9BILA|nr:unnamed protein product [Soboliphyme baturini]